MTLVLQPHLEGDVGVLVVDGEVDLATAPHLRAALVELLGTGVRALVIDAAKISFMDSSGLSALRAVLGKVKERGGTLSIAAPTRPIMRVLELTSFTYIVPVYETVESALGTVAPLPANAPALAQQPRVPPKSTLESSV